MNRCKVVLLVLMLCPFARGAMVQWAGNGHFYKGIVSPGISWDDARVAAEEAGGYLATIGSEEENTFVFDLINNSDFWEVPAAWPLLQVGPWFGGVGSDGGTQWEWVTGEDWVYENWDVWEPTGDENGVTHYFHDYRSAGVLGDPQPTWNDSSRDWASVQGYIVEYSQNPIPAPGALFLGSLGTGVIVWMRRHSVGRSI